MGRPSLTKSSLAQQEILQTIEDALVDQGFDDVSWKTDKGTFQWRTATREAELSMPPRGPDPTPEEVRTAAAIIALALQDHSLLLELISREFARRRHEDGRV